MADEVTQIVLFSYYGKTMIGKVYYSGTGKFSQSGTVVNKLIGQEISDFYAIENPCEVQFIITKNATGTATLDWKLKPYFYKKLVKGSVTGIPFIFPKQHVSLSNMCQSNMDDRLINAYKEICQII